MRSGMPYKVFVSHSMNEADRKAIEECEKQAKKHQIEFYLAENDTQPGASLAQKIKSLWQNEFSHGRETPSR